MSLNDLFITINHWLFFAKWPWESVVPTHPTISIVAIKAARLLWMFGLCICSHALLLVAAHQDQAATPDRSLPVLSTRRIRPMQTRHRLGFRLSFLYSFGPGQATSRSRILSSHAGHTLDSGGCQ